MKINAEFEQRVVVHSADIDWIDSPMPGVSRRPLDRVGSEVARATSIVRYAPGSQFSPHVHTGGEEFLVLDGVFQDEHGDFPVGSYIRNPPQSSHTPGSEEGCVIFVKLWQFDPQDPIHVALNSNFMQAVPRKGLVGVEITPLYKDEFEEVEIQSIAPEQEISINASGGLEIFMLDGELIESGDCLVKDSWLRLPVGSQLNAKVGENGAKFWIKRGHLLLVNAQVDRVMDAV
jgi:hypothetical protein